MPKRLRRGSGTLDEEFMLKPRRARGNSRCANDNYDNTKPTSGQLRNQEATQEAKLRQQEADYENQFRLREAALEQQAATLRTEATALREEKARNEEERAQCRDLVRQFEERIGETGEEEADWDEDDEFGEQETAEHYDIGTRSGPGARRRRRRLPPRRRGLRSRSFHSQLLRLLPRRRA